MPLYNTWHSTSSSILIALWSSMKVKVIQTVIKLQTLVVFTIIPSLKKMVPKVLNTSKY